MTSVYLGCMTIVLKLPFTNAASTKGLHKYRGFWVGFVAEFGLDGGNDSVEGKVADVGVVDRFGGRGARDIERLYCRAMCSAFAQERDSTNNAPNGVEERHGVTAWSEVFTGFKSCQPSNK